MSGRKVWAPDDILEAEDLMDYLMDQAVQVYASAAARAGELLAPVEGQLTYREDDNVFEFFNGSSFVQIDANNAQRVSGQRVFIQEAEPSATAVNDLWFF
jgi:Ser/Thr protein kinase RdoA (MazF antagonist)